MEIILPPHKKISVPVNEYSEIEDDCEKMKIMLEKNNFSNGRKGFAIAHCQVSYEPFRFFVTLPDVYEEQVIINPKILKKEDKFSARECCLSFPYRGEKKVSRFNSIVAKYLDFEMKEHEDNFTGLIAQIFQHEIEHFSGLNIYSK